METEAPDDTSPPETAAVPDPARSGPAPPEPPPRRLYRRRDGRIAGVAGGLADYLRIDPVLVRLAFVVSIFVGGLGIIAYLVAWLVLPVEGEDDPPAPDGSSARSSTANLATIVGIALLVIAVMIGLVGFDGPLDGGVLLPLALIAGGIFLLTQRPGESLADSMGSRRIAEPTVGQPSPVDLAAPEAPTTDGRLADLPPPPPTRYHEPEPPEPPEPSEPPNYITSTVLSLLCLVAAGGLAIGAGNWFDVTATQVLAVGLLVVGGGLVASAVIGRARGLIPLGILLTVATLATAVLEPTFGDGVGDRTYAPQTMAELEAEYDLGIGELIVDLRDLDLDPGAHQLRVALGIGRAQVIVPPDVDVEVVGDVSIGELELFGRHQSGIDNRLRTAADPDADTTLVLELDVGIGRGDVTR